MMIKEENVKFRQRVPRTENWNSNNNKLYMSNMWIENGLKHYFLLLNLPKTMYAYICIDIYILFELFVFLTGIG